MHIVTCKLVKEMLRIELTNSSLLVDLLNVEGARWAIRVLDLEIDGVYRTFPEVAKEGSCHPDVVLDVHGPKWMCLGGDCKRKMVKVE